MEIIYILCHTGLPEGHGQSSPMDEAKIALFLQKRMALYDKSKEVHYNLKSALHKSLRGSDCQAALYWLCRMLVGGENPLTIIRRLARFATEDIGLADPQALNQILAAKQAYEFLGSPEGELAIAQATIYLANAPKSNAVYLAYNSALQDAKSKGSIPPPKHILNAPTKVMKDLGYGDGYIYDHDAPNQFSGQNYFPEDLEGSVYYNPLEKGLNER